MPQVIILAKHRRDFLRFVVVLSDSPLSLTENQNGPVDDG
ncbi:hypothetical protein XM79_c12703 [Vibrio vulnificus]|nr:hypothetical protein VV99743_02944 [Vibrio vulnificus]OQK38203.1 hypothetical protein XM72_c12768 [Vibrio vulnificus]OQK48017.1 hypothetical protein XM75_c12621 [Vibrio vulnificus]OQK54525.1 hypothetical protein XM77_c12700 [Vibrio vulnificus]OQK61402.1 hypothetical protein XM78_c12703 [Vibrio vulnificus]